MRAAELHRLARSLREIALLATENTGEARVNAGELAVFEDLADHPGSTVGDITRRTGLAQSLVSRIVATMHDAGHFAVEADALDGRKRRVTIRPEVRAVFLARGRNTIQSALRAHAPQLSAAERRELEGHLSAAALLLRRGSPEAPDPAARRPRPPH